MFSLWSSLGVILLILIILLVLSSFVVIVRYGLSRGQVTQNVTSRLKYFRILLLGLFSVNPFVKGVLTSNGIEAMPQ